MSSKPTVVGDLIDLVITYTAPVGAPPGTKVTAAQLLTRSPDGTETVANGVEISDNVWRFTAAERITAAGTWLVRINANEGLVDSLEFHLQIRPSEFAEPLP